MAGRVSEHKRRKVSSETDDSPRTECEEVEKSEPQESSPEIRETGAPEEGVDERMDKALREIESREGTDERVSQGMDSALHKLEEMNKKSESVEQRLEEALDSLEEKEVSTEADDALSEEAVSSDDSPEEEPVRQENIDERQQETIDGTFESKDSGNEVSPDKVGESDSIEESGSTKNHSHLEEYEEKCDTSSKEATEQELSVDETQSHLEDLESHEESGIHEHISSDFRYDIDSKEALDKALQQNQHVKRGLSPESYETCDQYIRVISEDSANPISEIAEREDLSERTVENWRDGVKPKSIQSIENMESQRLAHEHTIPEEALKHRIEPVHVREVTANLREIEEHSVKELVDVVVDIHNGIKETRPGSIYYAELYDSQQPLVEDRLRNLAIEIRANREAIQTELNTRLGLDTKSDHEVRVGVTDNRLYYWHINTSPDEWLNVLADQKFYMSKEDKLQLIDEMRQHLHIRGGGQTSEYYLNDLINQMSGIENHANNRIGRYLTVHSLDGEVMHLIGDLKGASIEELKPVITHMGTKEAARVSNLKFPDIHEYRMKFIGIAESDCHLDDEGRFKYYEKNNERQKKAVEVFQEFGDFAVKNRKSNTIQVSLPKLLGTMAEYWGIPRGDKAIHNKGLHESIINETPEIKIHYPRQMVPEDGCFSDGNFSINRTSVLHPGRRLQYYRENYGIEPLVNSELAEFVKNHGKPLPEGFGYKKGERVGLTMGELQRLIESKDKDESEKARTLYSVVNNNPNTLIVDEVNHILKPLGIDLHAKPQMLYYYTKSERLSVKWYTSTTTNEQTIRWALISPPDHPKKMEKVADFMKDYPELVENMKQTLLNDGFEIHNDWRKFGI